MVIGKPCEGKPHARFDEGMVETFCFFDDRISATIPLYKKFMEKTEGQRSHMKEHFRGQK